MLGKKHNLIGGGKNSQKSANNLTAVAFEACEQELASAATQMCAAHHTDTEVKLY